MRKVDTVVIHCSASTYEHQTAEWIDKIHKGRGWKGIGYHYFCRMNGYMERGRGLDEIGAHVRGHNRHSIGICFAGLDTITNEQTDSIITLLLLLKRLYPKARLCGHCDLDPNKTCPGIPLDKFHEIWNGVTFGLHTSNLPNTRRKRTTPIKDK